MLICKYPLRIIFVDDDQDLLMMLKESFARKYKYIECYSDPNEFIDIINTYNVPTFSSYNIFNMEEDLAGTMAFSINIQSILNERKMKGRIFPLGIVVIDQNLILYKGLDICDIIKGKNIFKILLTGTNDKNLAIKSLNEKIINAYISKNNTDMVRDLENLIDKYIFEYFSNMSAILINLINSDYLRKSAINTTELQQLLKDKINLHNIAEYYLIDNCGSYWLINEDHKSYFLLISDTNSTSAQLEVMVENNINQNIITDVRSGARMLYFPIMEKKAISRSILNCQYLDKAQHFVYSFLDYNPFN